jgi:DNA-binding beta-propeller fold protein YncE
MGNHHSGFRTASSSRAGVSNAIAAVAVIVALVIAGAAGYYGRGSTPGASTTSTTTVTGAGATVTTTVTASIAAVPVFSNANFTRITVGPFFAGLEGVVYNPSNNEIYVAEETFGAVQVLNAATGAPITMINLTSGDAPTALAYDSNNSMIYVANDDYSTCSPSTNSTCAIPVIDTSNNTVVANIPTPDETSDVAVNPSTNVVYAPSNDDDATFIVNAATNQFAGILQNHTQIPDNSEVVAVDSSNNLAFVGNSYYHNQPVADLGFLSNPSAGGCMFKSTNESYACVTKSVGIVGGKIDGIAVDPTTGLIYVSNYNLGLVNVISESTGKDVANITVQSPSGIAIDPVKDMVYVASNTTNSAGADSLYVISGSSNTVLGVLTVTSGPFTGAGPENIALDTTNNTILLSNASDGTIWVIEESSLTI